MSPDKITVNYDQLAAVAARFAQLAADSEALTSRVRDCATELLAEGWQGRGAQAFADELHGEMLPVLAALTSVLEESQAVTQAISARFRDAEDEAARLFNDQSGPSSGEGGEQSGWVTTRSFDGQIGPVHVSGRTAESGPTFGWKGDSGSGGVQRTQSGGRKLGFRYAVWGGRLAGEGVEGEASLGGTSAKGAASIEVGSVEVGGGAEFVDGKARVGLAGEATAVKGEAEGVIGDAQAGLTGGIKGKLLSLDGFGGVGTDGMGLEGGFTLASIEGNVGANVAGYNVSVGAEVGWKWEWGLRWGQKGELAVGPVSVTFSFGKAKDGKLD